MPQVQSRTHEQNPVREIKPQQVLVTGGGGFLGFAIVAKLIRRGDRVCSFSRSRYPRLHALGVEQVTGGDRRPGCRCHRLPGHGPGDSHSGKTGRLGRLRNILPDQHRGDHQCHQRLPPVGR